MRPVVVGDGGRGSLLAVDGNGGGGRAHKGQVQLVKGLAARDGEVGAPKGHGLDLGRVPLARDDLLDWAGRMAGAR